MMLDISSCVSKFIFSHVDAQLFQHHLLRTLLSSTVLSLSFAKDWLTLF